MWEKKKKMRQGDLFHVEHLNEETDTWYITETRELKTERGVVNGQDTLTYLMNLTADFFERLLIWQEPKINVNLKTALFNRI